MYLNNLTQLQTAQVQTEMILDTELHMQSMLKKPTQNTHTHTHTTLYASCSERVCQLIAGDQSDDMSLPSGSSSCLECRKSP